MKVLEHQILATLVQYSLSVGGVGNGKGETIPIDKFLLSTSILHYGTLVALLNKNKVVPVSSIGFRETNLTKEAVIIKKYTWIQISISLEILHYGRFIKDSFNKDDLESSERIISLTKKGLIAFNTKYFIHKKREDMYKDNLMLYSIATIITTLLAALFAALGAYYSHESLRNIPEPNINVHELHQVIQELQTPKKDTLKGTRLITPIQKR